MKKQQINDVYYILFSLIFVVFVLKFNLDWVTASINNCDKLFI